MRRPKQTAPLVLQGINEYHIEHLKGARARFLHNLRGHGANLDQHFVLRAQGETDVNVLAEPEDVLLMRAHHMSQRTYLKRAGKPRSV